MTTRIAGQPTRESGRFVIETIDKTTECITSQISFGVDDTDELCRLIGADVAQIDSGAEYELQVHQADQLKARYKITFEPGSNALRLRRWHQLDDLPYRVHTGRELALMLDGSKPLACFSDQYPATPEIKESLERLFDPYVDQRRFVKREYVSAALGRSTWIVMYALPNQEWRINAMILLLETAAKSGWNEGFERMQGSLLGYEDWQNDIFIEKIYRLSRQQESEES